MARLLKGAEVTAALNERIAARAAALRERGVVPTLGIVRVGERPDDLSYERGAVKRAESLEVAAERFTLPADATQSDLLDLLYRINANDHIHGVLLFRPLPKHLDEDEICNTLAPEKDIDGITDLSGAGVFAGKALGYAPCTPTACLEILDHYGIDCTGKKVTVVGRSLVVGRPAAMLLLGRNATVTVCHTRTCDLPAACREADILVAAAGRIGMIGAESVRPGQIVLDVGVNWDPAAGKLRGDVDFEAVEPIVEAITPVPGGVGTVTTSVLVGRAVEAAEKQNG
jgi:methylenetetrahydrofolate dehydrogenase (NADP+)/methenyltetrahydrofolate cyclohydrolase